MVFSKRGLGKLLGPRLALVSKLPIKHSTNEWVIGVSQKMEGRERRRKRVNIEEK